MPEVRITKTMALKVDDLLRLIPALANDIQIQLAQNKIELLPGLTLEIAQQQAAKIGSMFIPQLRLDFDFKDWQQAEIEGFLEKFGRVFQRGGG